MSLNQDKNKKAYWCDKCQVPVLGAECFSCGNPTRELCSAHLKPVFRREINFLKKTIGQFNFKLKELECWVNTHSKKYFLNGSPLFKLCGLSKGLDNLNFEHKDMIYLNPIKRNKKTLIATIKKANEKYIKELQYEAQNFIEQMTKRYSGRTLLISFSGGKDSSVISHLVMTAFGRSDILHAFSDTTLESPDTYDYIEQFRKEHPLTPFIICKSPLNFSDIAYKIGPPSRILRWCCTTHKTNPLSKVVNTINPQKGVLTFDGVRKSESAKRSKYERITLKHKIGREILTSPILDWSELEIWIYILYYGLSFNTAYKRGFARVGCIYCPFNSNWSELMAEYYYPRQIREWRRFLYNHAKRAKHPNPDLYAKEGWKVRAGGRGLDSYKTMIESSPCELSEDAFFYQLLSGDPKNIKTFLRPFGPQTIIQKNNYSESFLINDPQQNEILATVEVSFSENTVRVAYLTKKNKGLLRKRIEKQIKKLQSCLFCGACSAQCPTQANRLGDQGKIIGDLCISCLKCVKHSCPVVDSLTIKGKRKING